jgi:hypothetical protein
MNTLDLVVLSRMDNIKFESFTKGLNEELSREGGFLIRGLFIFL